ncbi:AAA family ATPase [Sphingobacterium sp. HJSM2_6]|uniref:AAA family ATPase n=1 Tax=Sphingobacterium sp. HJSM2_6 TaxID=3366264 RepID=UPI003BBBD575
MQKDNFYILTGGPGTGKTTLIHALQHAGYKSVEEDARRIISEQIACGGEALPWKNKELYASFMLEASIKSFDKIKHSVSKEPVFFDRGVLDAVCYMRMEDIALSKRFKAQVEQCAYHKKVFILPPWKAIYEQDEERKQNWYDAENTYEWMRQTYLSFDYSLIEIPRSSVAERCQFIRKYISQITSIKL